MTKKNFKLTILMLIVGLTSANVKGQNLKDFYISSQSNFNKASFYTPGKSGERTEMTRVIYYTDNGDGTFDLLDAHMFQGQPTAIVTQTVKFTANEVKLVKTVSTTMFETNKKQTSLTVTFGGIIKRRSFHKLFLQFCEIKTKKLKEL